MHNNYFEPQPPVDQPELWSEMPPDPAQPTYDDAPRMFVERHWHSLHRTSVDEGEPVTATTVFVSDGLTGYRVEFGPWSFTADEAEVLATSLSMLAKAIPQGS